MFSHQSLFLAALGLSSLAVGDGCNANKYVQINTFSKAQVANMHAVVTALLTVLATRQLHSPFVPGLRLPQH